jgi:hypothetical protein
MLMGKALPCAGIGFVNAGKAVVYLYLLTSTKYESKWTRSRYTMNGRSFTQHGLV